MTPLYSFIEIGIVLIYVDMRINGFDNAVIQCLKQRLHASFNVKYLSCLQYLLGFEVSSDSRVLHQGCA